MTYGSEVWGMSDNQESIERVHLSALKRFLGVNSKSPRHLIYGETGRQPLFVNTYARCIKFWLRLTCVDDRRYPRSWCFTPSQPVRGTPEKLIICY